MFGKISKNPVGKLYKIISFELANSLRHQLVRIVVLILLLFTRVTLFGFKWSKFFSAKEEVGGMKLGNYAYFTKEVEG